jgi:hypothetical protein
VGKVALYVSTPVVKRRGWQCDNMTMAMNKRKILSTGGNGKVIRQTKNGKKKGDVSGIWTHKFYDPNNWQKLNQNC